MYVTNSLLLRLWPGFAWSGVTHISKLNLAHFSQGADHFSTYLIGNVQLGQAHVRRAEERILWWPHVGCGWVYPPKLVDKSKSRSPARVWISGPDVKRNERVKNHKYVSKVKLMRWIVEAMIMIRIRRLH